MYVDLHCDKCGSSSRVLFSMMYEVWEEGYRAKSAVKRSRAVPVTKIKCHCGNDARCDGPMFQYIFQLIFDEFVKEEKV